jgi:predicted DNA-binding transcriptional regulator AlpA
MDRCFSVRLWRAQRRRQTHRPLLQQWKDDPVPYRRACEEARLFDRLANCRDTVGSYPTISDSGEPVVKRTRQRKPTLAGVTRQATLPPTLTPRLICRDDAAAYVSVSPNTFDKMIADGLMPRPRRLTERRLAWDLRQLDAAIDRLPIDGDADTDATDDDHSWDDIDAQAKNKPVAH